MQPSDQTDDAVLRQQGLTQDGDELDELLASMDPAALQEAMEVLDKLEAEEAAIDEQ